MLGQNVALEPLTREDLPQLFKWINDRSLVVLSAPFRPVTQHQHEEWFRQTQERDDLIALAIRLRGSNDLIGVCQLVSIDRANGDAELRIRIGDEKHRGRGYGTEAVRLLLELAFRDLHLRRVHLSVFAENQPAIRSYEKAGFTREGTLRKAAYVDGSYRDVIVMAILPDDHHSPESG